MLLLDRVGVLAECYRHADWVMVGGSFRGKVHNVMEPAAWAKPITVGPHYGNSPEAVGMVESGAISAVSSAPGLAAVLGAWMSDPVRASTQGSAARDFLTARLGASERIADAIDAAIEAGPR
jgi:3-deoxy-D-manno-octulosonic-acid transferase